MFMEVKLPALSGNYDRQTDRQTDQQAEMMVHIHFQWYVDSGSRLFLFHVSALFDLRSWFIKSDPRLQFHIKALKLKY